MMAEEMITCIYTVYQAIVGDIPKQQAAMLPVFFIVYLYAIVCMLLFFMQIRAEEAQLENPKKVCGINV